MIKRAPDKLIVPNIQCVDWKFESETVWVQPLTSHRKGFDFEWGGVGGGYILQSRKYNCFGASSMDGGYSGKQWLPTGEGGKFLCLGLLNPPYPILQALGHCCCCCRY